MSWTNQNSSSSAGGGGVIKFSQGALLTPSAGVITPTDAFHHVAAGAITSIATTNFDTSVGNLLVLKANGVVTFTASASLVVNQKALATDDVITFLLDATVWTEIERPAVFSATTITNATASGNALAVNTTNTGNAFDCVVITHSAPNGTALQALGGGGGIDAQSTGAGGVAALISDLGAGYGINVTSISGVAIQVRSGNAANANPVVVIKDSGGVGANTKMLDVQTAVGGSLASIDVEGDASFTTATITTSALTAGTMTVTNSARVQTSLHRFDWTNAMVVALGASTTGDIAVCTLPAKTRVKNVYVVIKTPDTSANALTVAVGRTGAAYIDYIVASDAKAAANTVYGDVVGERGANLTGYDLPSYTGTTVVNAHFIKTTSNLSTVLTSTGTVFIETELLP